MRLNHILPASFSTFVFYDILLFSISVVFYSTSVVFCVFLFLGISLSSGAFDPSGPQ